MIFPLVTNLASKTDLETADLESIDDLETADLVFGNWRLDSTTFETLLNFDAKFDDDESAS